MAKLPDKVGRYPIVGLLATGGMAEILLGKLHGPSGFERPVVIKRALSHLARQRGFVNMFLDEARIVAGIHHPNVVTVHELGHDGEDLFLVMEYLDGENASTLMRRLRKKGRRLSYPLAMHIVAEACAGLQAAHELKDRDGQPLHLVHRDMSPQNVFITYTGQVKLIDFGIARAADRLAKTATGHVKGKFPYMSPEQCLGEPLDHRSDLFSLGTVLFELSTGRRLFQRPNELLLIRALCEDPLPRPSEVAEDYPAALEAVVMSALTRNPQKRISSAAELRRKLIRIGAQLPLDDGPTDALAALMQELFPERRAEKLEMIRRVQAGSDIHELPSAEVDVEIGLPGISDISAARPAGDGDTAAPVESSVTGADQDLSDARPRPPATPTPRRRRRGRMLMLAALLGAVLGTVLALTRDRWRPPPAATTATAATSPPAEPTASATATDSSSTGPPTSTEVTITIAIDSRPPGATVTAAGSERGLTPVRFTLPKDSTPVEVVLELPGHRRLVETIVPDVDVRLQLQLQAAPRTAPILPTPTATSSAGFRRFD